MGYYDKYITEDKIWSISGCVLSIIITAYTFVFTLRRYLQQRVDSMLWLIGANILFFLYFLTSLLYNIFLLPSYRDNVGTVADSIIQFIESSSQTTYNLGSMLLIHVALDRLHLLNFQNDTIRALHIINYTVTVTSFIPFIVLNALQLHRSGYVLIYMVPSVLNVAFTIVSCTVTNIKIVKKVTGSMFQIAQAMSLIYNIETIRQESRRVYLCMLGSISTDIIGFIFYLGNMVFGLDSYSVFIWITCIALHNLWECAFQYNMRKFFTMCQRTNDQLDVELSNREEIEGT